MTREEDMIKRAIDYEWQLQDSLFNPADSFMLRDAYCNGWKAADAHQPSPWISVEDRLPEKSVGYFSQWVLCRYKRGSRICYHVGMYDYEFDEWSIANVTHWMPIPELTKTTK